MASLSPMVSTLGLIRFIRQVFGVAVRSVLLRTGYCLGSEVPSSGGLAAQPKRMTRSLLVPQSHYGIDLHGAPGRHVTRRQSHQEQQGSYSCEDQRILRLYAKQQAGKEARQRKGAENARRDSREGQAGAASQNQSEHALWSCAQCHANADLLCSLADRVTHHAVDANGRKNQRKTSKNADQYGRKTSRRNGAGE